MQTGVPLWVPLVVAFVGLIGVLAGQVISAWREDKRWQRDRERDAEKLEHESRLEWRLQRFEVYKDFVASVDEFTRSMPARNPYTPPGASGRYGLKRAYENTEYSAKIMECLTAVGDAAIPIEFLAGKQLVAAANQLVEACKEARKTMSPPFFVRGRVKGSDEYEELDWAPIENKHGEARGDLSRLRAEFMQKVKLELALVSTRDDLRDEI